MRRWIRKLGVPLLLLLSDLVAIILAFLIAFWLRATWIPQWFHVLPEVLPVKAILNYWFLILIWPLVFAYEGLYTRKLPSEVELLQIWKGTLIAGLLAFAALFYVRGYAVSRLILLLSLLGIAILVPLCRSLTKRILTTLGLWATRALLVGQDDLSQSLQSYLSHHPEMGYRIVGVMEPPEEATSLEKFLQELDQRVQAVRPGAIFLSGKQLPTRILQELMERYVGRVEEILYLPDLEGLRIANMDIEHLGTGVVMKLKGPLLTRPNLILKRVFDVVASILLLILALPIWLAIALAIKWDSPGPVLFVQRRVGYKGRTFPCYKFRTMYVDAEDRLQAVLKADPEARKQWEEHRKLPRDPRVTRVGRFLRRFSLDELPQLLNVLKGDMSLVGPRPYLEEELPDLARDVQIITSVKPGLTGLWQVSGRSDLTFRERAILDEYYVRNWSLWLDLVILIKTLSVILKGDGAY